MNFLVAVSYNHMYSSPSFLCMYCRVHIYSTCVFVSFCLHVACFIYLSYQLLLLKPGFTCVFVFVSLHIGPPRPWLRPAVGLVWLLVYLPAPALTPLCDSKSQRGLTVSLYGKWKLLCCFKDRLHCCSTGTPLCSQSVTQCLHKPLMQEQAVHLHPPLYFCVVEAACFKECRFTASKISCNGWLRWGGGGGDYTDNYKTWECWKQLWVIMPKAIGDMSVVKGKNVLPIYSNILLNCDWHLKRFCNQSLQPSS